MLFLSVNIHTFGDINMFDGGVLLQIPLELFKCMYFITLLNLDLSEF